MLKLMNVFLAMAMMIQCYSQDIQKDILGGWSVAALSFGEGVEDDKVGKEYFLKYYFNDKGRVKMVSVIGDKKNEIDLKYTVLPNGDFKLDMGDKGIQNGKCTIKDGVLILTHDSGQVATLKRIKS